MDSLLNLENMPDDSTREQLLFEGMTDADVQKAYKQAKEMTKSIVPKPGFCLKTKTDKGEKLFINVCTSENLPAAKPITDEELVKLLESDDPSGYRVPMSIGEPHAELDKSGQGCTAYDVIVHGEFLSELKERQLLLGFFITIVLEGLEHKYDITIDRQWKILKNRRCVGSLQPQNVRTQSKPWIMDMGEETAAQKPTGNKSLISEVTPSEKANLPRAPEPAYHIIQEPSEGQPEFLVAEIHLPKIKAAESLTLDIGEDRILLETRANAYRLDIYLPYLLDQAECVAQFDRSSKVLTLTLPVQPES